ncbi:MAG: hypothetical protein E7641_04300 [Ruminococcaceae bacterium]|nr:hypothetical protein [Oscillospiraceae bacterium]
MYRKTLGLFCLLMIIFALSVSLVACGDSEDVDNNGGDAGDENLPLDTSLCLPITRDGKPEITVVSSYSKASEYAAAYKELMSYFTNAGIKLTVRYEVSGDPESPELIIGDRVNASGDAYIDPHSLGEEGYAIRVVGNKIIVAGGSTDSLVQAIELFMSDVLKLDDEDTDINNVAISRSTNIFVRQTYPIKSVTVGGNDISEYEIICDTGDAVQKACADKLKTVLYENAGYWLSVKKTSEKPAIRIKTVDNAGEDGFRVYVSGADLMIECAYPVLLPDAFDTFLDHFFVSDGERTVSFDDDVYTVKIAALRYEDFGAVGDGVTDDYAAIKATHDEANRTGQIVIAETGKEYYLGQYSVPITVKTSTNWSGATFIIDDSYIAPTDVTRNSAVFLIERDSYATPVIGITSLSKGQTNVGMTFNGPMLLYLVYDGQKQYIRYGANADSGASQQEVILVDKDGNVDPSTPILWDYPILSSVAAYPVSDKPITLTGGIFKTIANQAPREYTYYARNIAIKRSNVTVDGLVHLIDGEGDTGAPYNGFISISYCNNTLVKNTTLTGHKVYKLSSDSSNSMGTYDISISNANNVTFRDCRQTNSITDTTYWGIMGSNYCKNLTYDGCVFSRFDAHKGTHNATIINSEIGHQRLNIIGSGLLVVENTIVHSNNLINLRNDYGSTWEGDIILRNVTLNNTNSTPTLINANWYNHYFGYTCYLPANITIDGVTLAKGNTFYVLPGLKTGMDTDTVDGKENNNPVVLTKKIIIKSNPYNYNFYVSSNNILFGKVEVVEE